MFDTALLVLQIGAYAIAGAVVALHAIAPLTKSTVDDRALVWLRRVEDLLRRVLPAPPTLAGKREPVAPAK